MGGKILTSLLTSLLLFVASVIPALGQNQYLYAHTWYAGESGSIVGFHENKTTGYLQEIGTWSTSGPSQGSPVYLWGQTLATVQSGSVTCLYAANGNTWNTNGPTISGFQVNTTNGQLAPTGTTALPVAQNGWFGSEIVAYNGYIYAIVPRSISTSDGQFVTLKSNSDCVLSVVGTYDLRGLFGGGGPPTGDIAVGTFAGTDYLFVLEEDFSTGGKIVLLQLINGVPTVVQTIAPGKNSGAAYSRCTNRFYTVETSSSFNSLTVHEWNVVSGQLVDTPYTANSITGSPTGVIFVSDNASATALYTMSQTQSNNPYYMNQTPIASGYVAINSTTQVELPELNNPGYQFTEDSQQLFLWTYNGSTYDNDNKMIGVNERTLTNVVNDPFTTPLYGSQQWSTIAIPASSGVCVLGTT